MAPHGKETNMTLTRKCIAATLYVAALVSAIPAYAQDYSAASELRSGDMRKLIFSDPKDASTETFMTPDGTEMGLADFAGKTIVLNFWATWCAPCRKEMPSLEELRATLGGDAFDVVAVATGPKNEVEKIEGFYRREGIEDLPIYMDPSSRFANDMGIRGLPITVVLNPDGQEIARLRGDAEWASENAIAVLSAIMAAEGS